MRIWNLATAIETFSVSGLKVDSNR